MHQTTTAPNETRGDRRIHCLIRGTGQTSQLHRRTTRSNPVLPARTNCQSPSGCNETSYGSNIRRHKAKSDTIHSIPTTNRQYLGTMKQTQHYYKHLSTSPKTKTTTSVLLEGQTDTRKPPPPSIQLLKRPTIYERLRSPHGYRKS